jgi:hypoxanthine phosphoribosyltransferase|eukprot:evm.model.NODE_12998_length_13939_cov_25.947701.1
MRNKAGHISSPTTTQEMSINGVSPMAMSTTNDDESHPASTTGNSRSSSISNTVSTTRRTGIIRIPDEAESSGAPFLPISSFLIPPQYQDAVSHVLIPHGLIQDRIHKLAFDINQEYADKTLHLLCVLKGGSSFFWELQSALINLSSHRRTNTAKFQFSFDFVRVKSYEGTESTGTVQITGTDMKNLKGRHLLLVEDLIDSGLTMSQLVPHITKNAEPESIRVAALMEKRTHRSCGFKADYVAFDIPDLFVVGYSLDYNEAFRDMLHICVINEHGIEKFKSNP